MRIELDGYHVTIASKLVYKLEDGRVYLKSAILWADGVTRMHWTAVYTEWWDE